MNKVLAQYESKIKYSPHTLMDVGFLGRIGTKAGWDFEEDFATDTWITNGTKVAISGGVLNWDAVANGARNTISKDVMGAVISDTTWILRYKLIIDQITNPTSETQIFQFGFSDDTADIGAAGVFDFLGFGLWNTSAGSLELVSKHENETWLAGSIRDILATAMSVTTHFVEQIRTTATNLDTSLSSTDAFTKDTEATVSITVLSAIDNLRHLSGAVWNRGAIGSGHDGTIDDVQFNDATTEPS